MLNRECRVAAVDGDGAGADDLADAVGTQQIEQRVDTVGAFTVFHGDAALGDVHDLCLHDLGGLDDLGALGGRTMDLDQHQLALNELA